MLLDNLAVFVVTLFSSLFLCTTFIHGLPKPPPSPLSTLHLIRSHPSADLSSSLRLLRRQPVPSVDYDLGGDISEMLIGESNELSTINGHDDDSSSSLDASNEPFNFYLNPSSSESLSRKLLLSLKQEEEQQQQQHKRAYPSSVSTSPTLPTQFNLNSAVPAAPFPNQPHANGVVNLSQWSETGRLSPSLKILVETNPFARAWLTMLLQKVMEEQPVPYIFKYGRRRKK